jgi:hypothetical protein
VTATPTVDGPLDAGQVAILPADACRTLLPLHADAIRRLVAAGHRPDSRQLRLLRVLRDVATRTVSFNGTAEVTGEPDPASSPHDWIDSRQAADLLGVTPRRVCQLATGSVITARRAGRTWLLLHDDVLAYRDRPA